MDQRHIERTLLRVRLLLIRSAAHRMGLRTLEATQLSSSNDSPKGSRHSQKHLATNRSRRMILGSDPDLALTLFSPHRAEGKRSECRPAQERLA